MLRRLGAVWACPLLGTADCQGPWLSGQWPRVPNVGTPTCEWGLLVVPWNLLRENALWQSGYGSVRLSFRSMSMLRALFGTYLCLESDSLSATQMFAHRQTGPEREARTTGSDRQRQKPRRAAGASRLPELATHQDNISDFNLVICIHEGQAFRM